MDVEETLKLLDTAVFAKTDRHLSEPELTILRGVCLGMTYEQMADNSPYKMNYLMRDIGPKLWKLLSEVLGGEVSKANLRAVLGRQLRSPSLPPPIEQIVPSDSPLAKQAAGIAPASPLDSIGAPDVSGFCGRTQQLNELGQWIVKERCRLVVLGGVAGIGKTTLSVKLAEQLQNEFDRVIWRSLQQAPTLNYLLADTIEIFGRSSRVHLPVNPEDGGISQAIDSLNSAKYLIILDAFETILEPRKLAGHYQEGYHNYGEFIKRVAEQKHQSCLVIVTREMPESLVPLAGNSSPVRNLKLTGLDATEARDIFQAQSLLDEDRWSELIEIYQGNPLELKIVAPAIRELFGGKVAEFLKRKTFIVGGIKALLNEQFERLSDLEKDILDWLAIERRPVSPEQLAANLFDPIEPISDSDILEALSSLLRRELIHKNAGSDRPEFLLHQVVLQYVTEQIANQVGREIFSLLRNPKVEDKKIKLLKSHRVFKNQLKLDAKDANPIATAVKDNLHKLYKSNSKGYEQLQKIYSAIQNQLDLEIGYISENFQDLLAAMKTNENNLKQDDVEKQKKLPANSF